MLSNNDVPLVHSLYEGYNIQSLSVKRLINRDAAKRKGTEVLITNY
jgi:DNA adenine methylase